jgi:hypothetical protein
MKYQKRFCERAVFINLTFRKLVMNFGFWDLNKVEIKKDAQEKLLY